MWAWPRFATIRFLYVGDFGLHVQCVIRFFDCGPVRRRQRRKKTTHTCDDRFRPSVDRQHGRQRGGILARLSERLIMRTVLLAVAAVLFGGGVASAGPREVPPLAVADRQGLTGLSPSPGVAITLAPLEPGILAGTRTTANGSTFTGVVLQPGLYRVSWSWIGAGWPVVNVGYPPLLQPELNGDPQVWQGPGISPAVPFIEGLIEVTAANSVLQVIVHPGSGPVITGNCQLIVQQLQ